MDEDKEIEIIEELSESNNSDVNRAFCLFFYRERKKENTSVQIPPGN